MDLKPTEQQRLVLDTARDWLEAKWPVTVAGPWLDSDADLPEAVWNEALELGWTGLSIAPEHNGVGGDLIDLVLLQEELGKVLFPSTIMSSILLARLLDRLPDRNDAQARMLQDLAGGSTLGSIAFYEEDGAFFQPPSQTQLKREAGGWTLNGEKFFVRDARAADYVAVLAACDDLPNGIAWAIVERAASGVGFTLHRSSGRDRQFQVQLQNVTVDDDHVIPLDEAGLQVVRMDAMILEAAYLVGVGSHAHRLGVDYSKLRVQFGRPIGTFQAIQHRVADMTTDLESGRLITQYASTRLGSPTAFEDAVSAKLWVSEGTQRIVRHAHQIHGGLGYITEYPLYRYFRRAKTGELLFGTPHELIERLGDIAFSPAAEQALSLATR